MNALAEKALSVLREYEKHGEHTSYCDQDLINNGFSKGTAALAVKILEEESYIRVIDEYVSGSKSFELK